MKKSRINQLLKDKTSFIDILEKNTKNYKGEFSDVIIHAPKIYDLLCNLLESNNLSKKHRNMICSSIAYFILPKDIFPEDVFGPKGYLDDTYLCLHTLRELKAELEIEELVENWDYDINLLKKLLSEGYDELDEEFNYLLKDILEYTGLK